MQQKRLILDTTTCIDLFNGNLLKKVTKLPYELVLPDVIVAELINPPGKHLLQVGYKISHIPEHAMAEIISLRERYSKPSTNDLFAFLLAKLNSCELITGDDALRKIAKDEGVAVHGILWILDRLIDHTIVSPREAADALEKILAGGSWLPRKECEIRLKWWRN